MADFPQKNPEKTSFSGKSLQSHDIVLFLFCGLSVYLFYTLANSFSAKLGALGILIAALVLYPAICVVLYRLFWRINLNIESKTIAFHKTLRSRILNPQDIEEWGIKDVTYSANMNFTTNHFFVAKLKGGGLFEYPIISLDRGKVIGQVRDILGTEPKVYLPLREKIFWDLVFEVRNFKYVFPCYMP